MRWSTSPPTSSPLATPLNLTKVAAVAEALFNVVEPTFGACGKDKWVVNSYGQIVVTNSGAEVLRHVAVAHPVASVIRNVVTKHAKRHGDNAVSLLCMITAGTNRVAALCGDGDSPTTQKKRVALASALARLTENALRVSLLPTVLDRSSIRIPIPTFGSKEVTSDGGWRVEHRFRAGLRCAIATALRGAASGGTAVTLTNVLVTLVANSLEMEMGRNANGGGTGDDSSATGRRGERSTNTTTTFTPKSPTATTTRLADFVRRLRADPPVVAVPGAGVEKSALLRGVLLCSGLCGTGPMGGWGSRLNTHTQDSQSGPSRVVVLRNCELDDVFFGLGGGSSDPDPGSDSTENSRQHVSYGSHVDVSFAQSFLAKRNAKVLHNRGVGLVLSSAVVTARAANALRAFGIRVCASLTEKEVERVCRALHISPTANVTVTSLQTCDIGVCEDGFREIASGSGDSGDTQSVYTHVRARDGYVAVVRGFSPESASANAACARRAVKVAAAAFVVDDVANVEHVEVDDVANSNCVKDSDTQAGNCVKDSDTNAAWYISLVPGGGACEAALWACAGASVAELRRGPCSGDGFCDREADVWALDVLQHVAKAVPIALINADGDGTVSTQKQNGFFAKTPRLVVNLLAAATAKHETEITKEPPSAFPKDVDGRQPHKHNSLIGFVSTALAPETSHPNTAACVLDEAPWDDSAVTNNSYASQMCDPVRHAVLEPTASKRAAIAAAMACVASLTKIDQIAVARRGR